MAISKSVTAPNGGAYLATSLRDILDPQPKDERTFRDIVDQVWANIGE